MIEETNHGTLVAKKDGIYTIYVFQKDNSEYLMCTKLPNWGPYPLKIGDSGFITTQYFTAGEVFYDRNSNTERTIQYTNLYFKEFIPDAEKTQEVLL
ncbi:MAG: hypothetical protein Q4C49_00875 [Bacillota bacterium]|nr:hypothetical protein [Bacillota bacterium]